MNDRMEQEMNRTIRLLQASMPASEENRTSMLVLLRIATKEINGPLLPALFALVTGGGLAAACLFSQPMLTAFCTAPIPILLLFHRHILSCNGGMRELEATFRYSYGEMLTARVAVISSYMLAFLLVLSGILHLSAGEDILRLALCGAVPSLYLCALLLFAAGRVRNQETLSLLAATFWAALCFFSFQLAFDELLKVCSTAVYGALAAAGLLLCGACAHVIRTRRYSYGIHLG